MTTITTTTIEQFLRELRASGIRVVLRDERVHVSAIEGILTDELRQELHERRDEVLAYLLAARSRAEARSEPVRALPDATICPSSPATFVQELDELAGTITGSSLALELATTGPDPKQDQVAAIALGWPGRTTILDLRHYSTLPAEEQAAWREALQRLLHQGWRTWIGQSIARSWLFLLHHFGARLEALYDPVLVEQVLSGQDPGRENLRALPEIAACYQRVVPASEREQLALRGEGRSWFVALDQRPADWAAPLPESQVHALTQTIHALSRIATLQKAALQRQSLQDAAQIENDYLPALATLKAREQQLEQWSTASPGSDVAPPGYHRLKVNLTSFRGLDRVQQATMFKVTLTILYDTLPSIGARTISASRSEIILECPAEQMEEATRLVHDTLVAASSCISTDTYVPIPMPEVQVV
jgi:hypothetical protein